MADIVNSNQIFLKFKILRFSFIFIVRRKYTFLGKNEKNASEQKRVKLKTSEVPPTELLSHNHW